VSRLARALVERSSLTRQAVFGAVQAVGEAAWSKSEYSGFESVKITAGLCA